MEILKGRDHLEDLGVDGKVILESIFYRMGRYGMDSSGSVLGPVAGCCEHNERSGSTKGGEFHD
jgi:hypothetical protein